MFQSIIVDDRMLWVLHYMVAIYFNLLIVLNTNSVIGTRWV